MPSAQGHITVRRKPKDGKGVFITSQTVKYGQSKEGNVRPTEWSNEIPKVENGLYLWSWTHIEYSDGNTSELYSVSRMGIDGKGIESSEVKYSQKETPVNPEDINDWGNFPDKLNDGYWLYVKTTITYSGGSTTNSYSVSQIGTGAYYAGVSEYYAAGESDTIAPSNCPTAGTYPEGETITIQIPWGEGRPTDLGTEKPYLWNFEISRDSRGNQYVTPPVCIGNFSRGIISIVEAYAISSYSKAGEGRKYPSDITEDMWTDEQQDAAPMAEKPYQWNRTAVTYNDGETEYFYHVSAVRGSDGEDSIHLDLDNEMDSIPTDSTKKVLKEVIIETNLRMYEGSRIIPSGIVNPIPTSIKIAGITPDVSATDGVINIKWTIPANSTIPNDRYSTNIAVGYGGKTYNVSFTATAVRSGEAGVSPAVYNLMPSINNVSFALGDNNVLSPSHISLYCGYTKNKGGSFEVFSGMIRNNLWQPGGAPYNILYRSIGRDGIYGSWRWMKDSYDSDSKIVLPLIIPSSTTDSAYEFVLTSVSNHDEIAESNIIDREVIPINKDGLNGESAVLADLTNEMDAFGTYNDGKIPHATSKSTQIKMYYGTKPLDITELTISKTYDDGESCGDEVSVSAITSTGNVYVNLNNLSYAYTKTIYIDITAITSQGSRTLRFTLQPQAQGKQGESPVVYQLDPTQSSLIYGRDENNNLVAISNVLNANIKVIRGDNTETISEAVDNLKINYEYDDETLGYKADVGHQFKISPSIAERKSKLVLELWLMSGTTKTAVLDRETIPFIKQGKKGDDGRGIVSSKTYYQIGENDKDVPSGTWSEQVPTLQKGKYLWMLISTTYTSGDPTSVYSVTYIAKDGNNGEDGLAGKDGIGIKSTTNKYYASNDGTNHPSADSNKWKTDIPVITAGQYLWIMTVWEYTDGTSEVGFSVAYSGRDGNDGDNGVGVKSVESWYAISNLRYGVTPDSDLSWKPGEFQQPTETMPYAWKYTKTIYTDGTFTNSDCELICVYNAGVNPNLLEDTDFRDNFHLDAWDEKQKISWKSGATQVADNTSNVGIQTNALQGRNAFRGGTLFAGDCINYKNTLRQPIVSKLKPSTWYTLSYWIRSNQGSMFYNEVTSRENGFQKYKLYLIDGHTYKFKIQGRISATSLTKGRNLVVKVYNASGTTISTLTINSTSDTNKETYFEAASTGYYYVECYATALSSSAESTEATVTISRIWVIDKDYNNKTYVYSGLINTDVKGFVDGKETRLASDGEWTNGVSESFTFHTYTFKTKSTLPSSAYVLFRQLPNTVVGRVSDNAYGAIVYSDICMPKLEEGMMATGYLSNENSLVGLDGCIQRVSEWVSGVEFRNDEKVKEGTRYLDIAIVRKDDGSFNAYKCLQTHTASEDNMPNPSYQTTAYWEKFNVMLPIYTPLIMAEYAKLRFTQTNQLLVAKENGNVAAGMGGGNYPIWAGSQTPYNAPFRVSIDGILEAIGAELYGKVVAGKKDGQRVELDPGSMAMNIYNANNETVSIFEGNSYTDIKSLFANNTGVFTMNSDANKIKKTSGFGVSGNTDSGTYAITNKIPTSTPTEIMYSIDISAKADAEHKLSSTGGLRPVDASAFASVDVYLKTYDASNTLVSSVRLGTCVASAFVIYDTEGLPHNQTDKETKTISGKAKVIAGYHVIEVSYSQQAIGRGGTAQCAWGNQSLSGNKQSPTASYNSDFYVSRFFANGLCLGLSDSNYVFVYKDKSGMHFIAENNNYGINVSSDGVKIKLGTSAWKTITAASDGTLKVN